MTLNVQVLISFSIEIVSVTTFYIIISSYLPKTATMAVDANCNNLASSLLAGVCNMIHDEDDFDDVESGLNAKY